ncbi:GntR family transcriptional regulator [Curvivirga aplysinae]|uniref:GntR family transcriptional regulator n=1 Tax=Curvivirga aplysinae TaxID=2529852 RepID=UPI0012BC7846|nr:GntR family transcriptional regulator [Curvivirga aplysinae]MTI10794.1 GntR family transcriptional regulator [Curvivirga aplysinae]
MEIKEKLADQAYRKLEEMIVTLKLRPGSILSEPDLCERLEIGRTPVREALQRLSTDRLISIQPRRAMIVSEVSASEMLRVLEVRRPLELLIGELAANRADEQERASLERVAAEIAKAAEDHDVDEFMRADKRFDIILGEASRNHYAFKSCMPLQSMSRRFWYYYQGQSELNTSAQMHRAMMLAIASGEVEKVKSTITEFMDYLETAVRKVL